MPGPTDIEWDDGAAVDVQPQAGSSIEWDDGAAQDVAPPAEQPQQEEPGWFETVGRQMLGGFTDNWSDEAVGALASLDKRQSSGDVGYRMPDGSVRFMSSPDDVAATRTEAERQKMAAQQDAHPKTSLVANILGSLGKDATVQALTRIPVGSLPYQLVSGAIAGAGAADDRMPGGRLGGAALGAGGAAVGHGVGKYVVAPLVPKLARVAGEKLQQAGISFGRKALLNGADSLTRNLTPDDAVREALRPGMHGELPAILPMGTAAGAFKRLEARTEDLGKMYRDIVARLEAAGVEGPEARAIVDQMVERAAQEQVTTGANKAVPNLFMREALNVENLSQPQTGRLGLSQAEDIKRSLQGQARGDYSKTGAPRALGDARMEVASIMRQANEDVVEQAGKAAPYGSEVADLAESFTPVKQRLSRTIAARDAAEKGAQKGANRSFLGLAGKIALTSANPGAAAMGVATGGGMMNRLSSTAASGFYGLGAASKASSGMMSRLSADAAGELGGATGRSVVDEMVAPSLPMRQIRRTLQRQPEALGQFAGTLQNAAQRGEHQLAVAHFTLMQRNPEYRQMFEGIPEDE